MDENQIFGAGAQRGARNKGWIASVLLPLLLFMLIIALAFFGLSTGAAPISPYDMGNVFLGGGDDVTRAIMLELRLPRLVMGLAIGAALGMSGALLQAWLRNPLADSAILGTANMAALGAVIAFYFGFYGQYWLSLPLMAMGMALLGLLPLLWLARRNNSPVSLILAGLAIGMFASAAISLALNLAPNPFAAMEIMHWLMGSLDNMTRGDMALALPFIGVAFVLMLWDKKRLDALVLSDDSARALGVNMSALRLRLVLAVALATGAAVAVSGVIGFVGLVVPHLVRPFTDKSPSSALIPSALAGAALVVAADIVVRIVPTSNMLKLGVVTAFIGTPIFLMHLIRQRPIW